MTYYTTVDDRINDFKMFIQSLKILDPGKAKKEAERSLGAAGLLDEDGHVKQDIVNGDFFGWGENDE